MLESGGHITMSPFSMKTGMEVIGSTASAEKIDECKKCLGDYLDCIWCFLIKLLSLVFPLTSCPSLHSFAKYTE